MSTVDEHESAVTASLWRTHSDDLVRFATMLVGPADSHDVAVDAFLRCVPAVADFEPQRARAYLVRAVANEATAAHRSRRRRWRRDLAAIRPTTVDATPRDVDVLRAVSDLSVAQRSVVYFVYWEDRTERETAEILGVSPGTVRRHLVRARLHLRKALR